MTHDVAVQGNYAYVTTWSDSASASYLAVVDISDPTSPSIVGSIIDGTLGPAMTIAADEGHVYLPSGTGDGMIVVDVSDPSNPTVEGSATDSSMLTNARGIAVSGSYVYVVGDNGLSVLAQVCTTSTTATSSTITSSTASTITTTEHCHWEHHHQHHCHHKHLQHQHHH